VGLLRRRSGALTTQRYSYATGLPSDKNHDDAANTNHSAAGEKDGASFGNWQHAGENDDNNNAAAATANDVSNASGGMDAAHTPSLRDALPPSEVELPETSFLKCIEKEMMDEKYRLDKEEGPPPVPAGWTMHHTDGTSFIYGRRVWVPPPTSSPSSPASTRAGRDANTDAHTTDAHSAHTASPDSGKDAQRDGGQAQQHVRNVAVPRPVEKHFLRLQLTTRDASLDPECDVRGEHFPFSFFVQRVRPEEGSGDDDADHATAGANIDINGDAFDEHTFYHDSIEVRCDVVDGELVVDNVVYHGSPDSASLSPLLPSSSSSSSSATTHAEGKAANVMRPHYVNPFGGYPGPNLDEAEEEVLDGIQSWLAERGVDDQLGEFVGQYAIWIEQAEYEMWLQQLHDYVAA
jgi:hypothetical protein